MTGNEFLAERFEERRPQLRAVAYRMLGSLSEADDAVQEAWLRLSRSDSAAIENLGGWLTTVVGRVCLDMLRSRTARREEPLEEPGGQVRIPDPIISGPGGPDPEQQALLADSVGLALLVVLETLGPAERLAFVLHDLFAVPFDDIAPVIGRTPAAARQLASRARRRVQATAPTPGADPARHRRIVDAFLAAARDGDLDALVAVLDPDVVVRSDGGALRPSAVHRGATNVASQAITFARFARASASRPVLVNGTPGVMAEADGRIFAILSFTIAHGKITALDILTDPERLARIDPAVLDG
ncbi:DNA-directed RNA polymerase sigma-70 factor [Sphaerisporangium siamense]|uniref:RNA polymerase sigma-70 factor (ECF subfamily) n=1 Tax=Sphaerisporangium siamense TaxID=795645 RepID=A0A7W7GAA3_9ACTN|nr:RNA polymerase sigma factor SigJ [Sphaerisporangium siamense]MBB4699761.1 RNA polymerase sigma-70 factor (ECF subfamily) [Sphaerisporangium siamense]GII87941.1 DNA-directed RNA polymerase sigma-70 factor [Sphaerisporangium siamense]